MRSLTCTSTRLHANACLGSAEGCDTTITQGAWLLAPPLLSMDMKRGNAYKPITGAECMLNHIRSQKYHGTLANVGTSSSSPEEPHLASAPAWFSWYGPRPIPPSVDIGHLFSASRSYDMLDEERPVRRQALLHTSLCCLSSYAGDALPSRLRTLP